MLVASHVEWNIIGELDSKGPLNEQIGWFKKIEDQAK